MLCTDLKEVSVLVLVGVLRVRREAVEHRHSVSDTFQSVGTATPLVGHSFLVENGQVVRAYLLRLFSKTIQRRISEAAGRREGSQGGERKWFHDLWSSGDILGTSPGFVGGYDCNRSVARSVVSHVPCCGQIIDYCFMIYRSSGADMLMICMICASSTDSS